MVDSLRIFEILKAGSIPEPQARAMTQAIQKTEADIGGDIRSAIRQEFAAFETKMDFKFASIDQRFEVMRTEASETKVELLRWMFAFWIGQSATTIGLIFVGLKLLK